jgi:hypothetical protein
MKLFGEVKCAHGRRRTHTLDGDNPRFFPFAQIARHSGGVFIRRSFKSAINTLARFTMGPRAGNAAAGTATRETPRVAA